MTARVKLCKADIILGQQLSFILNCLKGRDVFCVNTYIYIILHLSMYGLYTEELSQPETYKAETGIVFDEYDTFSEEGVNHGFGPIPEKRQKRAACVSVGLSLVIMLVLLGSFTKAKEGLYAVEGNATLLQEDEMICKKNPRLIHVGVFIWSLNLIGIILGEFTNRLCLMFEEYFHLYTRYNGSKMRMFCACFSDVSLRAVFFATVVAFIIISSTLFSQGTGYFRYEYIEIILSGFGSSTFVLYILSMDTLSRVQISSLMENNNRLVANGLAWSYYFGYLKLILPNLNRRITESKWGDTLSSRKLFIMMPRDCWAYGRLSDEAKDNKIECLGDEGVIEYDVSRAGIAKRSYRNNIYKVKIDESDKPLFVLAEYATPLCSMYDMSHSAEAHLSNEDRDEQAKLFVRTLEAILTNPNDPEARDRCVLVPYARGRGVDVSRILADAVLQDINGCTSLDSLDGIIEETRFDEESSLQNS